MVILFTDKSALNMEKIGETKYAISPRIPIIEPAIIPPLGFNWIKWERKTIPAIAAKIIEIPSISLPILRSLGI